MLTLEESRWSLNALKTCSALNVLPIRVDVENGRIKSQSNRIKLFIWKTLFGVGVSHWLYIFGRLVQSTVIDREKYFRWDHFVLHFGMTGCYAVFYFTGFCLFVKNTEENVIIFNQLFEEREDPVQKMMDQQEQLQIQPESSNETRGFEVCAPPRPLLTWPLQYSLDELLAKFLPLSAVCTEFFALLFLAVDPNRPQLLYSVLPPEFKNVWSFLMLFVVEATCMAIVFLTCEFAILTQVLFFGKCQLEFKRLSLQLRNLQAKFQNRTFRIRHIAKEIWILRQILEEMRELVVLIELFNRCFPFCIFAWKICCLSICILFYFFVTRHFEDFPVLAVFIGYIATAMTVIYSIMYGRAFSIPGKMQELKQEFLQIAQKTTTSSSSSTVNSKGDKNTNTILWAEMQREIKRIRGVGIKVGNFNQMERESTPNFIDFVLRNVVTLLVTFSRK